MFSKQQRGPKIMSCLLPRRVRKRRGRFEHKKKSKSMGRIEEKKQEKNGGGGVKRKRGGKARKTD